MKIRGLTSPWPLRARLGCAAIAFLAALFFAPGCAHYQLGTGATPAFRSLYIEPVSNRTLLPQSQAVLTTRLRENFARDGRVALANSAETADATLSIVVQEYRREISVVRENDTGLARKFDVTLGATCTLRDNRAGKLLFENRPVNAMREVFTDSGQLQAEYHILPLLAEALAAKVVHAALDVW